MQTLRKAKKLGAFLYIDGIGGQMLLLPKTVMKQEK
jgi:hypothetical protein